MNEKTSNKTKVRYAVHYQDRNYEYALHSAKRFYIRNIADVVNVLEYCVSQDLKTNLYKPDDKMYNFNVVRLVNDVPDTTFDEDRFKGTMNLIIDQVLKDNIQRNS